MATAGAGFPERVAAFHQALDDGDLATAADVATRLQDAAPGPVTVADAFATALADGRTDEARTHLFATRRTYEAVRAREAERGAQAQLLQGSPDVAVSDRQRAADFFGTSVDTDLTRGRFVATAAAALAAEEPTEGMTSDIRSQVDPLGDAEAAMDRATSRVASAARNYDLPGFVAVSAVRFAGRKLPVGGTGTVRVSVANVGDAAVDGVGLATRAASGIEVVGGAGAIGTLAPGDTAEREVRVRGTESGRHRLVVGVRTQGGRGTEETTRVEVVEHLPLLYAADVDDDGRIDTEELQRVATYWDEQRPVPETNDVVPSREDLRRLLVYWSRNRTL